MQHPSNRREFMKHTARAAGAGLLAATSVPSVLLAAAGKDRDPAEPPIPIVDTHQHLWDLEKLRLPWLKGDGAGPLARSFVMSDYLEATKGLNVVKAVYMEVNVHPSQQAAEAEHVIALCRRKDNPTVAAVIGGSPQEKGFAAYVEKFARSDFVKGVRTVLHDADRPKGMCLEPRFVESMQRLGELGLSFDLCMRPAEILDGARLAGKCPKTRFIIDHCGNMPVESSDKPLRARWMKGMKEAAALENTVCKISGVVVTAAKDWKPAALAPVVDFCLDTFGENRVFFGGDWPVCTLRATLRQWTESLKRIVKDRPAAFRRKLFHDNAVRFYGLDSKS